MAMPNQMSREAACKQLLEVVDEGLQKGPLSPSGVCGMAERLLSHNLWTTSMLQLESGCSFTYITSVRKSKARTLLAKVLTNPKVNIDQITPEKLRLRDHIDRTLRPCYGTPNTGTPRASNDSSQPPRNPEAVDSSQMAPTLSQETKQRFYAVLLDPNYNTVSFQLAVEAYAGRYSTGLNRDEMQLLIPCFSELRVKAAVPAELLKVVDEGLNKRLLGYTGLCNMAQRLRPAAKWTESMVQLRDSCESTDDISVARSTARTLLAAVLTDPAVPFQKVMEETSNLRGHIDKESQRLRCVLK